MGTFGPTGPDGCQLLDFVGIGIREVLLFGPIGLEVVEFPWPVPTGPHQFLVSNAYGGVPLMFPIKCFAGKRGVIAAGREQVVTL
jgi:hypothetical protein